MNFFVSLLSFFAALSSSDDGWVAVEKKALDHHEEVWEDQDQSIWPVFSKKMGSKQVLVRFPVDPKYRYLETGVEIFAQKEENLYSLQILSAEEEAFQGRLKEIQNKLDTWIIQMDEPEEGVLDLYYFSKDQWVAERLFLKAEHLYIFQISSPNPLDGDYPKFIHSIEIL